MISFNLGDLVKWVQPTQDPDDYKVVGLVIAVQGMTAEVRWSDGIIGPVPMRALAHLDPCDTKHLV